MYVHLDALGCRLNEAELQAWGQQFRARGLALTREPENANAIVVNTCAVTGEAARKSRQLLRRLHRKNPTAKLFVTGCYASLEAEQVQTLLGVDRVINNSAKDDLVNIVVEALSWSTMPELASEPAGSALFPHNRDRAFIKIQDGCRYRCTYCIVTVARGEEKSRSIANLVSEVNAHAEAGIQEVVLTGVHVGGYGSDTGSSLYDLVVTLLAETDMPRIRFASVEPWDLSDNFFSLFENPRLMPHMHLPIQSGVDSVLRRMSRRCKTEDFRRLIYDAKQVVPDFNVTTDIIVGFPGETEAEWQATTAFVESMAFGHIHIFSFSPRVGTKAANLPNPISKEIKKQRSAQLHTIARQGKLNLLAEQLDRRVEVLWESGVDTLDDGRRRFWGHTPNFHRVSMVLNAPQSVAGQLLLVKLVGVNDNGGFIEAELAEPLSTSLDSTIPIKSILE